ncbi:MAG: phosphatidylglycerol---prolipoprotein diacylglyceryl transferase [Actinomycetota bacterium]|nr:phosphatidylglycerol---prolipoprotein diacylglyceryl transferase [Actinomycetota bacterium]
MACAGPASTGADQVLDKVTVLSVPILSVIAYNPLVRIHLGPLSISPHGIGIAVGFLVGAWFMLPTSRAKGIPDEEVYPLFTLAAIGAIIGSRVAYVINHIGDYRNVLDIFAVWKGGISLIGGIIGAILLAVTRMRRRHLPFWKIMDAAMPGLALGIFVGRTGDLIIADHLGKTTTFFLGYRCPPVGIETGSPCFPGTVVHQTALYDQFFALVILLILLRLRRSPRYDGFIAMMFGAMYASARVVEDFLREDLRRFGLTGSQMTAILVLSACLYGLVVLRRTPRWGRWDETSPDAVPTDSEPEDPGSGESSPPPSPSLDPDVGGEDRPEEGDRSGDPDRGDPIPEGDRDRHG